MTDSLLWVDRYKPTSVSKIIGQAGEKSNANKLKNWLKCWQQWHCSKEKTKKSWNDQDTGSSFKAALLSGPPGIGKTTTAQLVCQEMGYTYIEMNASDARSKKLLDSILGSSVENCSIDSYFKGKHKVTDVAKDKHCIIMDEVDGMDGNGDRGGIQELIQTIKESKIPIICICNDRQHQKIRTLATYCFDLKFHKPNVQQVRAALLSVCFREKIKISNEVLDQVIIGSNQDIRQCLTNLSMWSSTTKSLESKQTSSDIEKATKDVKMNMFEAARLVFKGNNPNPDPSKPPEPPITFFDRIDYFFVEYRLMPLFMQENYLNVKPASLFNITNKKQKDAQHFKLLEDVSESLIASDRIGRMIATTNNWNLLPTQGVFTTLIPGMKLCGSSGFPTFPSWLGKNSKQRRVDRILQELQKHMRLHISANKIGVGMDYLSVLKQRLSKPLISKGADGIPSVIYTMNEYFLTRDDFDTILELSTWPGQPDPMSQIDSRVKASFTRAYNKEKVQNPFCIVNVKKVGKGAKDDGLGMMEGEDEDGDIEEEEEEDTDDPLQDAMIKVNTKKTTAAAAPKKTATTAAAKKAAAGEAAPKAAPVKRPAKASKDDDAKPSVSKKKKT